MAELNLPEGPYEIESLMREISRLLSAAADTAVVPAPAHPRVQTGIRIEDLLGRLHTADETKHPTPNYAIRSHRPILGLPVSLIKKMILWALKPQLNQIVEKQEAHNEAMLWLQHALIGMLEESARTNEALMKKLSESEEHLRSARDLFDRLSVHIRNLDSRYDLSEFFSKIEQSQRMKLMNQTRGPQELIRQRFEEYLEEFRNRPGEILDIGCGRGEFLEHLRTAGIRSWGCDLDPAMVAACRELGLEVRQESAVNALNSVAPASLGGIFCAQVIEHLFPGELLRFIMLARERIAGGGVLMLESLNPQSLGVLSHSYYRDLEHKQPVDPDYLSKLLEAAGFVNVRWTEQHSFQPSEALQLPACAEMPGITRQTHEALQDIVNRLNRQIWGAQDYCVVAEVPVAEGT